VAVSLRTRRFREAEHLAGMLDNAFSNAWSLAMREAAAGGDGANINAILRHYLQLLIGVDLDQRLRKAPGQPLYDETDPIAIRGVRDRERQAQATGIPSAPVAKTATVLMATHGFSEEFRRMVEVGLSEAILKAVDSVEARMHGVQPIVFTEQARPQSSDANPIPVPRVDAKSLMSSVEGDYFEIRATVSDATHQVMGQERGTLRRFRELLGDRSVNAYGRGDITRFLATLRRLPKTYGKSPRDKNRSLAEIVADADRQGAERLSDKTVKRHLSTLSQFYKVCFDKGYLTAAEWKNLVGHHTFRDDGAARDQRDRWLPEELAKLFNSPVWRGCDAIYRSQPGPHIIRDWRFWLPILALFHGARLEEFADLSRADLQCDGNTWSLKIQEGEDRRLGKRDQDGRMAQGRRLKNSTAARVVPLHPELVRLGFLQHVAAIAPNPQDPLFPDLQPQGKDRKRGPRVTRWFVEYRKAIGVFREGVAMHAFRHTANTRLRDAMRSRQDERIINHMLGHIAADGGEGGIRYDKGPQLKAAAKVLARLQFKELDFTHLYVS
jgi:integrase